MLPNDSKAPLYCGPTSLCPQAVFTLQSVVEYFNVRGSSVFAAALDITKAFDTVKHSLLFRSLIQAGVPTWIVLLIVNWYS